MTPAVTFEAVASDSELAAKLLNQYETELVSMYPKFTLSSGPSALPSDFTIPHGQFVIGYVNGEPCCSGGVKVVCSGAPITCEVKRMYVLPEFRGRGLSKALLTHLETIASSEFGACKIRLDTGPKQANSAALYTKSGYEKVPPFNDNEFASLWLEKTLARSYSQAVSSLYSLGISKTAAAINAAASGWEQTVEEMRRFLDCLAIPYVSSPSSPQVLHVTGTKGKGSTTCMAEVIARRKLGRKTGMFTSPHLVSPRERIRINGLPVSEAKFAAAYWHVYDTLESSELGHPKYFRFLTLLALYIFDAHRFSDGSKIDTVLLEVGIGGRYDATNVYTAPTACAITTLDLDHTRVLGDTLEKIAWEKGGIIKEGCPVVSAVQEPGPAKVLQDCADEKKAALTFVRDASDFVDLEWKLGLKGDFQRENAALAIMLTRMLVGAPIVNTGYDDAERLALEAARWPGRCQRVDIPSTSCSFFLDGCHTEKSMEVCLAWFKEELQADSSGRRVVLLFNCSHERNPVQLLELAKKSAVSFDSVIFSASDTERPSAVPKPSPSELLGKPPPPNPTTLNWQETLAAVWPNIPAHSTHSPATPSPPATSSPSVLSSLTSIQECPSIVLCCGSLYIVGSALEALGWEEVASC